jgi:hypothetical protein
MAIHTRALTLALLGASAPAAQHEIQQIQEPLEIFESLGRSMSVSGTTALVGAPFQDQMRGAVYVYDLIGGAWVGTAVLTASDGTPGGQFGFTVDLDGERAAIGSNQSTVYVFEREGGSWAETRIAAASSMWADAFGLDVALDGTTLLASAAYDDTLGANAGAVYAYELAGGLWTGTAKLLASDGAAGDRFGDDLDLDGDRALIGAFGTAGRGPATGSAYVFERAGGVWSEVQELAADNPSAESAFGSDVSLSGDVALIGAQAGDTGGEGSGSAYVFELDAGSWSQTAELHPPALGPGDHFGWAVAVDGARALIGAYGDDLKGNDSGTAFVFERRGACWAQKAQLEAFALSAEDWFGWALALDGEAGFVGAPLDDYLAPSSGAAFVYDLASVSFYGCGLNPGCSLGHLSGPPRLGSVWTLGAHNPLGTQPPGATLGFLALSAVPPPGYPCGPALPGWGMAGPGASGELLLGGVLSKVLGPSPWSSAPAPFAVPVPAVTPLAGVPIYFQALLFDGSGSAAVPIGLTEAVAARFYP